MTDIEQKARDMVLEVLRESELPREPTPITREYWKALCRAIEQHEAFRQEMSDVVGAYLKWSDECLLAKWDGFEQFIISKPKPDPLVEMMEKLGWYNAPTDAKALRAALEARGLEIREKNDD